MTGNENNVAKAQLKMEEGSYSTAGNAKDKERV
jgi:hypothetical protein